MFLRTLACGLAIIATCTSASRTLPAQDAELDAVLERFVGPTTVAIARVDVSRLTPPKLGGSANQVADQLRVLAGKLAGIADDNPVYAIVDVPTSPERPALRMVVRKTSSDTLLKLQEFAASIAWKEPAEQGDYVICTPVHSLDPTKDVQVDMSALAGQRPELKTALSNFQESPIQIAVTIPNYVRRTIRELLPELPVQLGGGPSSVFTEGAQWATVGFDPGKMDFRAILQASSEEAAGSLAKQLPISAKAVISELMINQAGKAIANVFASNLVATVEGDQVQVTLGQAAGAKGGLLAALADSTGSSLTKKSKAQRMKQIGLAMHNHESAYKVFPPAKYLRDEDGKPRLSWRVAILPFIEQNELYQKFKLDEPWDSAHNITLLDQMPDIYKVSSLAFLKSSNIRPGYTTFQAPVGEGTIYGRLKPTMFANIQDGTSNTVMAVEVKPELAVPWTAPQDYRFDVADPGAGLELTGGSWLVLRADGSVQYLSSTEVEPRILHALFGMNDGIAVQQ